jgi:hydrogenase maturation protease
MKTLVLGVGNLLLGDEGVGVHAARALIAKGCPDNTVVLDIGTAILDALPAVEEADRIIVVDAIKADGSPGTIYRMPFDAFLRPQCIASMHGFDFSRLLALAEHHQSPEVLVFGVEPRHIDWSLELSSEVQQAMPALLEAVCQEISPGTRNPGHHAT